MATSSRPTEPTKGEQNHRSQPVTASEFFRQISSVDTTIADGWVQTLRFLLSACIYFGLQSGLMAEVASLSWETRVSAPVQTLPGNAQKLLPAFRLGLEALPESSILTLALSQPALLGLSRSQSAELAPLVSKRYELIAASPEYSKLPSQLPYCFSEVRPSRGSAFIQIPAGSTAKSPAVVFLHGYGGSFLWYLHWLSEALPTYIIVAPAYGISPADVPAAYLIEAIDAASVRLGFPLPKPTLVGLSAGGFGACRAYQKAPDRFERLVGLGAYPPDDTIRRFTRNQTVRFVAGAREPFVKSGHLQSLLQTIRATCPSVAFTIIPEADHFFMLSHPDETRKALQSSITGTAKVDNGAAAKR
jgi:pimeloyl-ACP methyl ester carboxylesterase